MFADMNIMKLFVFLLTVTTLVSGGIINFADDNLKDHIIMEFGTATNANISNIFNFIQKMSIEDAGNWLIKKKFCEEFPKSMWCQPDIETDFPDDFVLNRTHCVHFNETFNIICAFKFSQYNTDISSHTIHIKYDAKNHDEWSLIKQSLNIFIGDKISNHNIE